MVGRIYKADHYAHCYTQNRKALGLVVSEKMFFMFFHCKSMGANGPWGMVGRIYKWDNYTLLQTKYESSWPCSFGEDFLMFPGADGPRGLTIFDARDMVGRIDRKHYYTLLHTIYESSWPCGFGEEDFVYVFP